MSNYIKTSDILDPNINQPYTGNDLDFWQAFNKENIKGMVYGQLGESLFALSQTRGVVVSGCTKSGSGDTIFNGWMFYQDEIYYFPGGTGLNSYSNPPIFQLDEYADTTYDPVEFTDAVFRNVHFIRRLKVADSVTGLFLMSNVGRILGGDTFTASATSTSSSSAVAVTGSNIVTPNRICDLEITATCRMSFTADGANQAGGVLRLVNATVFAIKAQTEAAVGTTVPNGQIYYFPTSLTYIYRNIPANTTIQLQLQTDNVASPNATVDNIYITYREVSRPKLW